VEGVVYIALCSLGFILFVCKAHSALCFTMNYNIKFLFWQDIDADKSPISVDGALAASSLFKIIVESHLKGTNLFIFSFKCNLRLEECYRCCKRFSILFTSCILITLIFFDIAAADSAFEDTDDTEYFHVSVSSMLKFHRQFICSSISSTLLDSSY
jgi:hypothetical protein